MGAAFEWLLQLVGVLGLGVLALLLVAIILLVLVGIPLGIHADRKKKRAAEHDA